MTPHVLEPPPPAPIPDEWRRWFYHVFLTIGYRGQGTFPQLQVGAATWTSENAAQDLINLNKGIYVNYSSTVAGIIYGFACNVRRAAGSQFVVGAQINAYANRGVTGGVFGLATTAVAEAGSNVGVTGYEPNIGCLDPDTQKVKWGVYNVFKNRRDGATAVAAGLGNNRYNLYSSAHVLESQVRSSTGEYCGWNVGIDFHDQWCDQQNPPAWSATVTYTPGLTVTSGGLLWRAIQTSLNQAPAAGSLYWVQRTYAGTADLAVGIDFSTMGLTAMTRMASAIRLRSTQSIHWDETGAIGSNFNAGTGMHTLSDNQGALRFGVNVGTGVAQFGNGPNALGGGAAPAFGTIGGTGPTVAAQNAWMKHVDGAGVAYWVPIWR
jgi:hypothetical protein